MDDYSMSSLTESKNEWCVRLVNIFTPALIAGLKSIFKEAWILCKENDEEDKYLMTFQTFLSRIPKWNTDIIETERKRISEVSGCGYLEELITCVHIIQLKALSCVRVGQKQKKIDINIPSVDDFVHKIYINVARKLYTNIYLFEKNIAPLQIQKHNRELELIIKECVLNTVRDTIPVETILRAYMDETVEQDVEVKEEEILRETDNKEENKEDNKDASRGEESSSPSSSSSTNASQTKTKTETENTPIIIKHDATSPVPVLKTGDDDNISLVIKTPTMQETPNIAASDRIEFSDTDNAISTTGVESTIEAPKTIERLEQISNESAERRKAEDDDDDDDDNDRLTIGDSVKLEIADVNDLNRTLTLNPPVLDDIEFI
jgi:hypothetical protein